MKLAYSHTHQCTRAVHTNTHWFLHICMYAYKAYFLQVPFKIMFGRVQMLVLETTAYTPTPPNSPSRSFQEPKWRP